MIRRSMIKKMFIKFTMFIIFCSFVTTFSYSQTIAISTIEQLQLIGTDDISYPANGNYVLTQDIDASATRTWNSGAGFIPLCSFSKPFSGTLDGQGYKITGLYINRPTNNAIGIFSYLATHIVVVSGNVSSFNVGKVKNLVIVDAEITGSSNIGCVAGNFMRIGNTSQPGYEERHLIENVKIINSKVKGDSLVGGIIGYGSEGTIQNCFVKDIYIEGGNTLGGLAGTANTNIIRCCSTGSILGQGSRIGGLIGFNNNTYPANVSDCFSTCWVIGLDSVGGLIGNNTGNVAKCFAGGIVYGITKVGGLVGDGEPSKVQNSFWDINATQQLQSGGGSGLSTNQMLSSDTFQSVGWDYGSVWGQNIGITRPYLQIYPPNAEEISLSINSENGTVNPNPASPYYLWSVVQLTSVPDQDYALAGYEIQSGNFDFLFFSSNPNLVLTMSSSTNLFAKFLLDQPISIDNIEDLQKIGNNIDYPPNWTYHIISDIDATDTQTWNAGKGFNPLGNAIFRFSGELNGYRKTISNLYINRDGENLVALFKYASSDAVIKNLIIENANITGGDYTALIAGENTGNITEVEIRNSHIEGNNYVSGITSSNTGKISYCVIDENCIITAFGDYAGNITASNESLGEIHFSSSSGSIMGISNVGGISGINYGIIRKSYSIGSVMGAGSYIGGLVGANMGTINQSYSHSNIFNGGSAYNYAGGLVGLNYSLIIECYSKGNVAPCTNCGGLVSLNYSGVNSSFWDTETSGLNTSDGGIGKTTAEMLDKTTYEAEGWDFNLVWANDNNTVYPYLLITTIVPSVLNISLEDAQNLIISSSLTVGDIEYQCSDTVIFGNVIVSEPLPGWEVPVGYTVNLVVSDGPCPPPTKVLTSIDELQQIGNSAEYPLDGGYELGQDIDASNTAGWNSGQGFSPIGNQYNPFTGYFDSKGFKVKNLTINRPNTDNIGLFGKVSGNAIIKNLILEDVSISGKNNTGGVVGACEGGAIYNVSVSGTLSGKGNLGGIVGLNQGGNISDCYANVILSNSQYNSNTGGIVGQNQNIITRCYSRVNMNITNVPFGAGGIVGSNGGNVSYSTSVGTIKASDNCGGIVGSNAWSISKCWANVYLDGQNYLGGLAGKNTSGLLNNSFATGTVKASFYSGGLVGGLVGGTIENCYSIGKVVGISGYIGGLIGYQFGGEVNNSFWNVITSRINTSFGGTGKSTTELLNIDTFLNAGWDFDNIWYFPSKTQSYPQLKDTPPIQFISIPRLIDLTQTEANNALTESGLNRGAVLVQCNTAYPAGVVFAQTPEENHLVAESYPVDMSVSSGPCPTNVPNVVEFTIEQAEVILANANLLIGNVNYQCSNLYDEGIVLAQNPIAGTQVPEGSSVDITVSQGPCMTTVPYTIGLPQVDAEVLINASELTVTIVVECNDEIEAGIVFGQEPSAGTQVMTGTEVTIYVSSGPCVEGITEGEGVPEGILEGEGIIEGEGIEEGIVEGEGVPEGILEGEGIIEGEGIHEGTMEGEGIAEGIEEGEGIIEGEVITEHSADIDGDGKINLSELLRVIQFFNIRGYHCEEGTEDGYAPGLDGDHTCRPHASDYNPQDWQIDLGELLRLIQIFNIGHYYICPGMSEDGFCF